MKANYPLLAGPWAAVIFALGVILLPLGVPGYSSVHQTVSEIGMGGSPMRIAFILMLCVVALCLLFFGWGLRSASLRLGHSPLAGYLVACAAVSAAGVALFPAPIHNYFGLSELIGYQAPLALALTWRRDPRAKVVVGLSSVMSVLMWCAIAANLSVLDRGGSLFAYERPVYGLVQRALFLVFFAWCYGVGQILRRRKAIEERHAVPG